MTQLSDEEFKMQLIDVQDYQYKEYYDHSISLSYVFKTEY